MIVKHVNGKIMHIDSVNKLLRLHDDKKISKLFVNDSSIYYDELYYKIKINSKFHKLQKYVGQRYLLEVGIGDSDDVPFDSLIKVSANLDLENGITYSSISDIVQFNTFPSRFHAIKEFFLTEISSSVSISSSDTVEFIKGVTTEIFDYNGYQDNKFEIVDNDYLYIPVFGIDDSMGFIIRNELFSIMNSIGNNWSVEIRTGKNSETLYTFDGWNSNYDFIDLMFYIPQVVDVLSVKNNSSTNAIIKFDNSFDEKLKHQIFIYREILNETTTEKLNLLEEFRSYIRRHYNYFKAYI